MKNIFILIACFIAFSAHAGSEVCASRKLYYSYHKVDSGIRIPTGSKSGSLTIVYDSKFLVKLITAANQDDALPGYTIEFTGTTKVLSSTGNSSQGSNITKKTAILYKTNTADGSLEDEVAREEVICQKSWRMAI